MRLSLSHKHAIEELPYEPQRLGAAEPQPKCERPLNRRDAMSAEKTAGEKTLLELRDSGLLHCDERREKREEGGAHTNHLSAKYDRLAANGLPPCSSRLCGSFVLAPTESTQLSITNCLRRCPNF